MNNEQFSRDIFDVVGGYRVTVLFIPDFFVSSILKIIDSLCYLRRSWLLGLK
jgi:hypothetical protein